MKNISVVISGSSAPSQTQKTNLIISFLVASASGVDDENARKLMFQPPKCLGHQNINFVLDLKGISCRIFPCNGFIFSFGGLIFAYLMYNIFSCSNELSYVVASPFPYYKFVHYIIVSIFCKYCKMCAILCVGLCGQ